MAAPVKANTMEATCVSLSTRSTQQVSRSAYSNMANFGRSSSNASHPMCYPSPKGGPGLCVDAML